MELVTHQTTYGLLTSFFVCLIFIACPNAQNGNPTMKQEYKINEIVTEYADKTTKQEHVDHMKTLLEEAIQEWILNFSSMGFYKEEDYKISDIMLFGKEKDKVLLFVYALLKDSDDGEAKLLTGQLEDDNNWHFRNGGLPNFYFEYVEELRKGQKFTELEIMARTIDNLVEDGLVTFYNDISQDYIANKWF